MSSCSVVEFSNVLEECMPPSSLLPWKWRQYIHLIHYLPDYTVSNPEDHNPQSTKMYAESCYLLHTHLMPEIMAFFLNASNRKVNAIFSQPKHFSLAKVTTVNMSVNRLAKWAEGNTRESTGEVCTKTLRCGRDWGIQYSADVASSFTSLPLQWMQVSPITKTAR